MCLGLCVALFCVPPIPPSFSCENATSLYTMEDLKGECAAICLFSSFGFTGDRILAKQVCREAKRNIESPVRSGRIADVSFVSPFVLFLPFICKCSQTSFILKIPLNFGEKGGII